MRQSIMRNDAGEMIILGRLRTHKFTSGGHVKKQVADRNRRADIAGGIFNVHEATALDLYQRTRRTTCTSFYQRTSVTDIGLEFDLRNRCYRRQCFAPKPKCSDASEVFESDNF